MVRAHDWRSSARGSESLRRLDILSISFRKEGLCHCLSEEKLKAISPFYLVSMSRELQDPTVNVYHVVDSIFYLVNNVYMTLIKNSVKVKAIIHTFYQTIISIMKCVICCFTVMC